MLVRLIVFLIIMYILYRVVKGILRLGVIAKGRVTEKTEIVKGEDLVEDPVCHTFVPVSQAFEMETDGVRRYFCSRECYEKYKTMQGAGD